MKNILTILGLLISSFYYSQMAVYDAGTNAQMGEQIATAGKQLSQLEKTYILLNEASDKFNHVNGYVKNINDLKQITIMYRDVISSASQIRQDLPKIKNLATQRLVVKKLQNILTTLGTSIETINLVLSNDFFKMDDTQRMNIISKERRKILIKKSQLAAMR